MTKKSFTTRVKVTKTGKLLRRKKGSGHNKAKKKRKIISQKRNLISISRADTASINRGLN